MLLLMLGLIVWFWTNTLRVRELAIETAREACRYQNLQFLDATVVMHKLAVRRSTNGQLVLQRTFLFAYSEHGDDRRTGFVITSGNHVDQVGL